MNTGNKAYLVRVNRGREFVVWANGPGHAASIAKSWGWRRVNVLGLQVAVEMLRDRKRRRKADG